MTLSPLFLSTLTPSEREEIRYLFEERAGLAMDSGATKEAAEQIAWEHVRPKHQQEELFAK